MRTWMTGALVASTLVSGLMAGLFAGFAYSVMPGLKKSGDHSFVEVMQNINVAIVNPLFMTLFMGGLAVGAIAVLGLWRGADNRLRIWLFAGLGFYLVMLGITSGINVPLNDQLAAAGDPNQIDLGAARSAFEDKWVVWNIARAVVNVASFASFAWSLVLLGRVRNSAPQVSPVPAAPGRPGW
ncbi:anthrone oxygenase family protein [Nocardia sp. NPDC051030]|uniref:anthrone oxygenase family protein n=1 Tax=Nocardia sp. NPDC051030 TaxID=3155162 RepID=UPI00342E472A